MIEALPRLLTRGVPAEVAATLQDRHIAEGVSFHFGARIEAIEPDGVRLADGTLVPADLVVVGIGAVPNSELAAAAGLAVENGIAVDATLASSDPAIFAAGDCCSFPLALYGGRRVRLESWRSAQEQGTLAAAQHARRRRGGRGRAVVLVRPVRPDPADRRPRRRRLDGRARAISRTAASSSSTSPPTAASSPLPASGRATRSRRTSASPRCSSPAAHTPTPRPWPIRQST